MVNENIIQCEYCDQSITCKLLNPYQCESFAPTINSSFDREGNENNLSQIKEPVFEKFDSIIL